MVAGEQVAAGSSETRRPRARDNAASTGVGTEPTEDVVDEAIVGWGVKPRSGYGCQRYRRGRLGPPTSTAGSTWLPRRATRARAVNASPWSGVRVENRTITTGGRDRPSTQLAGEVVDNRHLPSRTQPWSEYLPVECVVSTGSTPSDVFDQPRLHRERLVALAAGEAPRFRSERSASGRRSGYPKRPLRGGRVPPITPSSLQLKRGGEDPAVTRTVDQGERPDPPGKPSTADDHRCKAGATSGAQRRQHRRRSPVRSSIGAPSPMRARQHAQDAGRFAMRAGRTPLANEGILTGNSWRSIRDGASFRA